MKKSEKILNYVINYFYSYGKMYEYMVNRSKKEIQFTNYKWNM